MNPSGETPDWQSKLKSDIGENPARFLDREIPEREERWPMMFAGRLRGIDRLEVVGAWRATERRLAADRDRQPRQHVLDALTERERYLLENGERPQSSEEYFHEECPGRFAPRAGRDIPEKKVSWVERDRHGEEVERRPWSKRPTCPSVGRSFDSSTTAAELATDGGEPE